MKDFASFQKELTPYLIETFHPEDEALEKTREATAAAGLPEIQVGPMDGLHLEIFARMVGVKRAVEIGTLGGYSGTFIARGLSEGGKLYTFELEEKNAEVSRKNFEKTGVSDRVEILVGPAIENLPKIENQGPFDLVFIDADKVTYPKYLDWAAKNLRIGGIVLGDNTFAYGNIHKTSDPDPDLNATIQAVRQFNTRCAGGDVFRGTMIPTGEGLTLAVKLR